MTPLQQLRSELIIELQHTFARRLWYSEEIVDRPQRMAAKCRKLIGQLRALDRAIMFEPLESVSKDALRIAGNIGNVAGREEGRAEERAAVVTWLRRVRDESEWSVAMGMISRLASGIEDGDHYK